jgi:hypothetical protein
MASLALVDTCNNFAGVTPFDELKSVKKFTSRKTVVTRIWESLARISPDGAQQAADVFGLDFRAQSSKR